MLRSVAEVGADLQRRDLVDELLDVAGRNRRVVLDPGVEVVRILEVVE